MRRLTSIATAHIIGDTAASEQFPNSQFLILFSRPSSSARLCSSIMVEKTLLKILRRGLVSASLVCLE